MDATPALVAAVLGLAVILAVSILSNKGQFDAQETTGVILDTPATSGVERTARAIAHAEGFGVPLAIPTQAHNPGDLKIPHWPPTLTLGEGISVFASDAEGWARLYRQLNLIVAGASKVYTLGDTIDSMAVKWTGSDNAAAWARIVASDLGTESNALLAEILT